MGKHKWWLTKNEVRRKCGYCNEYFLPKNDVQIYCNRECREKAQKYREEMKRAQKNPLIIIKCRKFKTIYIKVKYCSDICRNEDKILKLNKKWAEHAYKKRKYQNLRMQMFYELGDKPSDSALKKCNACRG